MACNNYSQISQKKNNYCNKTSELDVSHARIQHRAQVLSSFAKVMIESSTLY
jgi:hypothetical protein